MREDGLSPVRDTPHWAKAQRGFLLALSTWKECRVRVQIESGREVGNHGKKHGERQNEEATREDGMTRAYRHTSHAVSMHINYEV